MPPTFNSAFRLACLLTSCLGAQTLAYATGLFLTNGPAVIKAVPVGWSFPKAIDTVFVFETKAGNKVDFILPVALSTNAIRPWHPVATMPSERFPGLFKDAAGRSGGPRMGHRVWFTESTLYGDTTGILKTLEQVVPWPRAHPDFH